MSEPKELYSLYLGENLLSGNIPNCWMNWKNLVVLNLKGNNLTGNVPTSIGFLHKLTSLQLHDNQLSGELPLSMQNCTSLLVVDLGKNKLVGSLPIWMGKSLSNLKVLNIRSNELQGDIPHELCYLKNLLIMDLANNSLSGTIPRCFHNFSAMAALTISNTPISIAEYVMDNVMLVTKGREMEYYFKMLRLVISIDLSDNIISGEIPEELASLLGLRSLNLSKNLLTGSIPSKISNMKWLESVDLSMNQLDGEIPQGMRSLTFLSHLNLSYNNFTGQIPKSTQLQSLDQSSFIGNHLCGPPLNDDCGTANRMIPPTLEQDRGYHLLEDKWFYLSLGIGFALGFWSVLGSLLVNMPWSILLSQFLNNIVFKLHAVIVKFIS